MLLHIIYNARDILEQNKIQNGYIKVSASYENEKYQINIEDNGGGIEKEIIGKVFDPYFTTKHQSMGTGMGLSICQFIVTNNLGGIITTNNALLGAKFTISI